MRRRVQGLILLVLSMVLGTGCQQMKVEPGQVGILVNYQNSEVREVKAGSFWWNWNAYEHLTTYPITQQTMVMVQATKEGKVQADDSIPCRDNGNNQVSWDVAMTWRVDPLHAADLYYLKREMPLDDPNSDSDIAGTVVRQVARSRLREVCPLFAYTTMEQKRVEIAEKYTTLVKADMAASYLVLDEIFLRDLHLSEQQQTAINAFIAGNQALAQAEFTRQQAVKAAETNKITYEAQQAQATYEAEQTNLRTVAQAKAAAEATQAKMQAEAEANRALAASLTPQLTDYVRAQHWNGQGPTTVLGTGVQPLVQVP